MGNPLSRMGPARAGRALLLSAAVLAWGAAAWAALPVEQVLTLSLPDKAVRLATAQCDGQRVVLLQDQGGRRQRPVMRGGLLALEPFGDCALPDPVARPELLDHTAVSVGDGAIAQAWLAVATLKYRHGVLGSVAEARELRVLDREGEVLRYPLDDASVFEDRVARLVTLDNRDAVLVVRTRLERGAAAALFGLAGGPGPDQRLVLLAESPPIGRPNTWLNPVGVADFDGDGHDDVAVVLTPHAGGTLVVYRHQGQRLVEKYRTPDVSNHALYSGEQGMSAILDVNDDGVPDLIVPDAARRGLRIVTYAGGRFGEVFKRAHSAEIDSAIGVADLDDNGRPDIVYTLKDNTLVVLLR